MEPRIQHTKIDEEIRRCSNCGESVVPGAPYCAQCGTNLVGASNLGGRPSSEYAGFWQRFGAYLIDMVIVFSLALIPGVILGALVGYAVYDAQGPFQYPAYSSADEQAVEDGRMAGFYVFVGVFYFLGAIYWTIGNALGGSWGKRAVGIRIVKYDGGSAPRLGSGFLRWLFASLWSPLIFFLGFLWMLWDGKKQTWHDKVAGTIVVRHVWAHRFGLGS